MRLDSKTEFYNISYFFDLHDSFFITFILFIHILGWWIIFVIFRKWCERNSI